MFQAEDVALIVAGVIILQLLGIDLVGTASDFIASVLADATGSMWDGLVDTVTFW